MEKIKKFNTQIASHLANNLENSLRELRRCGAHRSSKATFTEMGIQLSGFKNDLAENNKFNALVGNAWIDNEAEYYLPAAVMTVDVQRQEQEVTTYVLNDHALLGVHKDRLVVDVDHPAGLGPLGLGDILCMGVVHRNLW